jgi:hypothetical protein
LRTGLELRLSAYVALRQDTDTDREVRVGGVKAPVRYERYGLPYIDVHVSRFEGRNTGLGPSDRREPTPRLQRRLRRL